AEGTIRKVLHLSNQAISWEAAGEFFRLEGNNAEAERQFRRVLAKDPADESALLNLAGVLMATGRMAEAGQVCAQTSQLPKYRQVQAVFLFQTGKTSEAVAELQR